MTRSVEDALRAATAALGVAGIEAPHREARVLLGHVLGVDLAGVLRDRGSAIAPGDEAQLEQLVARRAARAPAALLLGHREFWSLDFLVTSDTLIPRPDSELIIEIAVELQAGRPARRILDLGTGTGCLLLAALTECPGAWGLGVDRSEAAAVVARLNAQRLGLSDRSAIMVGSWTEALADRFDLILCNPPYIPSSDIDGLMPEVAQHEPHLALDGGTDGLGPYRIVFADLHRCLAPGGSALFEFGEGQAPALLDLARQAALTTVAVRQDLAGHPRVMIVRSS